MHPLAQIFSRLQCSDVSIFLSVTLINQPSCQTQQLSFSELSTSYLHVDPSATPTFSSFLRQTLDTKVT